MIDQPYEEACMRPIEIILSGANLIAFFGLALPLPPALCWLRYAAPLALVVVIAHFAVEGPRWQMIPAYALAAIFCLIWLFGIAVPAGLHVSPILAGLGIAVGALGLLVSLVLPIALPVFHFPPPAGPYAIGTMTYHWGDVSRPELVTTDPDDRRELMAQVWYPARRTSSLPPAPYLQEADVLTPALARLFHLPGFFLTHLRYVTTHAVNAASVAEDQARYPVLIFLPGLYGFRQMNTFQIEALVSNGYIVVGLDQPGAAALVTFPDGRQVSGLPKAMIDPLLQQSAEPRQPPPTLFGRVMPEGVVPYFAADVSFALDQLALLNEADPNHLLTGRLDLDRAGVLGVSLGGLNGAEACFRDARLKACLIMDVFMPADVVREGLPQPTMWITRDAETMRLERERAGGWSESDIEQHQTTMRAAYERLSGDAYYLQISRMFHLNLTDVPYWIPLAQRLGLAGPLDRQRVFDIINAYSLAFFDTHLKGQPSPLLDGSATPYPEVMFETRRGQGSE
jgi:predicted dienelactone hydrolase